MSAERAGVAIESGVVRGVVRTRQGVVTVEVPWDPSHPESAVKQLRKQLGEVRGISLSIGLAFLAIARPELPPLDGDKARRVLLRDPDRYFPLEGRVAVATGGAGHYAFATSSERLEAWLLAFATWAPVRAVYAAPHAIVEALSQRGASISGANMTFTVDADAGERGLLSIVHGQLQEVRRLPEAMAANTMNGARPLADSALGVASGRFAAAMGALSAADAPLAGMLLDGALEGVFRRRRQLRLFRSMALFAASLLVLGWAADASRDRALGTVQQRIAALETSAAPAFRAQARLARTGAELAVLSDSGSLRADALAVLSIVSRALPASAFVQRLEWNGSEWRVDGSTDNAAQVVPQLDAASALTDVHALGASTRFRDGARMRESFAVAFHVKERRHDSR